MKQHSKWFAAVLAVASGLVIVNSAQAQPVTGTPDLSNLNPAFITPYASWPTATITVTPTGLEVFDNPSAYGSLFYDVVDAGQSQTLNPLDTYAVLTFTVNQAPNPFIWVGTPFILNDNFGSVTYGGLYSGFGNGGNPPNVVWNGNVVTWTVPLVAGQVAAIQTGTDTIYGFNLEFDPAVLAAGSYDITFNSLTLVPEPATLALVGLGAAGLLIFRRRN